MKRRVKSCAILLPCSDCVRHGGRKAVVVASEVTQLLLEWSRGNAEAVDRLIPLVYDELRRLARGYLRRERANHTLEPTALVHEAFLRLVDRQQVSFTSRTQFFALCATLMRHVLVDHARRRSADKRGGDDLAVSLSRADQANDQMGSLSSADLIALDDALRDLATLKPQHARAVELRFFGGLTIQETAAVLGVSHATVERDWAFAKAWLKKELRRGEGPRSL